MFDTGKLSSIVWPETAEQAVIVQNELTDQVRIADEFDVLTTVVGVDCSYDIQNDISHAFIVLMRLQHLEPVFTARAALPTTFPYIPGFLSFREIPVILEAMKQLPEAPDLLMVDGQGIAHPRRLGIAAHLGVLLDLPAIGVAKSRLTGRYEEPGPNKGDTMPLMDRKQQIGTVLRSKEKTNPLFISPGHRIGQKTAIDLTIRCLRKHRLPEPTRIADKISKNRDNPGKDFYDAPRLL